MRYIIQYSTLSLVAIMASVAFAENWQLHPKFDLKNKNTYLCLDGSIVEHIAKDRFKLTRPLKNPVEVEFYNLGNPIETTHLQEYTIFGGTNLRDVGVALVASPFHGGGGSGYYKAFSIQKKMNWIRGPSQSMLAIETQETVWDTGRLYHTYTAVDQNMIEALTKTDKPDIQNVTQNRCMNLDMYLASSQHYIGQIRDQEVLNLSLAYSKEFENEIRDGFNIAKLNLKERFDRLSFRNASNDSNPMQLSQGPSLRIVEKFIAALDQVVKLDQPLVFKNLSNSEVMEIPQSDLRQMIYRKILGGEFASPLWKVQIEKNISQDKLILSRLTPESLVGAKCYDRYDFLNPDHEIKLLDGKVQYVRSRGDFLPTQYSEIHRSFKSYKSDSGSAREEVSLKSEPHFIWKLRSSYSSVYTPITEKIFKFENRDPDEYYGPDDYYFGFCVKN